MMDFWVFGYGSLIWNPGFEFLQREKATLFGLHRSLCIHSWVHRGTQQNPGLVLGLDKGGACTGIAMKVRGKDRDEVIEYLRARELVTDVYLETWRKVSLSGSRERVDALLYRVDQAHQQYAKGLSLNAQTEIVSNAQGGSGHNRDYVKSTVEALRSEGIKDAGLESVYRNIESST